MRVTPDANVLVRAHPRSQSTYFRTRSYPKLSETINVLRYPRLQKRFGLTDEELYDYAEFLRQVSPTVVLSQPYHAPLRDGYDLRIYKPPSAVLPTCSAPTTRISMMIQP